MRSETEQLFAKQELLFLGSTSFGTGPDFHRYEKWLEEKRHASMVYLEKNQEARKDPNRILEGTKSVLVFALPYSHPDTRTNYKYALYSEFKDYHRVLKERGEQIVEQIKKTHPGEYRVVVDSAPVLERALAAKTVDGFIGKNTCYIHPKFGSFLLLGEIFTTAEFVEDAPTGEKGCETCTLCQVACPTGALDEDYRMDARKCLAYWTIEHRGTIPFEFWPHLKDYVFGCDLCQTACPYNKEVPNDLPKSIAVRKFPEIFEVATMTAVQYEEWFGGTPVTRAKREGLRRNALIALAVSGHARLGEALEAIETDPHPLLLETAKQIEEYHA